MANPVLLWMAIGVPRSLLRVAVHFEWETPRSVLIAGIKIAIQPRLPMRVGRVRSADVTTAMKPTIRPKDDQGFGGVAYPSHGNPIPQVEEKPGVCRSLALFPNAPRLMCLFPRPISPPAVG